MSSVYELQSRSAVRSMRYRVGFYWEAVSDVRPELGRVAAVV